MKTTETRQKDNLGYLKLPMQFTSKGFHYEQLMREENFAIYTQKSKNGGLWFIPIIIQKQEEYKLGDTIIPKKEVFPNAESFGTLAYTCMSLEEAKNYLTKLQDWYKNLDKEKS